MRKALLAASLIVLGTTHGAATISIQLDAGAFHVTGWTPTAEPSDGWASVFPVYAGPSSDQPMLGTYEVNSNVLTFHPRFPITAGVHYHAVFQPSGIRVEASFDGPPLATNPITRVDRIYPSTNILPSNALRLYIYFSAPMSRGEAWPHIHLIDTGTNRPVDIPFLELDQELWDQNNQRLTVLFDPGRIKRGLVPTTTIGPSVVEGKHYKLVIDRDWHDARGVSLVEGFEKPFTGGPSYRVFPDPAKWHITAPTAGTTDPLIIAFKKPMDYVLLQRMIGIFDARGELPGKIAVDRNETEWRFTPREPWKPGTYRITADNTLEDISGNHLDRPFDVDTFEKVTKHITSTTTSIPFTVSASEPQIVLGVLEQNPAAVRVAFQKNGSEWKPFPSDCPDQACLKTITAEYPPAVTWTIAFSGRAIGQVTAITPKDFELYSAIGLQKIAGKVPSAGKRPVIANSQPFASDPDSWKPSNSELTPTLRAAFRKKFPNASDCEGKPSPYRDADIKLKKVYSSNKSFSAVQLTLTGNRCEGPPDDPFIDQWFAVTSHGETIYLGQGMSLIDAGDYDNDGKSELVFAIDRYNQGGYELFYNGFQGHAVFQYSHH